MKIKSLLYVLIGFSFCLSVVVPQQKIEKKSRASRKIKENSAVHAERCPDGCEACQGVLKRALSWIAKSQQKDGGWKAINFERGYVASNICGFALLASGSTPSKGPYKEHIQRTSRYVQRMLKKTDYFTDRRFRVSATWHLAFTAMFLAEVYDKKPSKRLKTHLQRIYVKLRAIHHKPNVRRGHKKPGGWPYGYADPKYQAIVPHVSAMPTICALTGIVSIEQVGIDIEGQNKLIRRGLDYAKKCSTLSGKICYSPRYRKRSKTGGSASRTAAVIYVLQRLKKKPWRNSLRFVRTRKGLANAKNEGYSPSMALFFAGLMNHILGPEDWKRFWKHYRNFVAKAQRADGSFRTPGISYDGSIGVA